MRSMVLYWKIMIWSFASILLFTDYSFAARNMGMGDASMGILDEVSATELNPSLAASLRYGQVFLAGGNPSNFEFGAGKAFGRYGTSFIFGYGKDNDIKSTKASLNFARNLYKNPYGTCIDIGADGVFSHYDSLGTKENAFYGGGGFSFKPLPAFSFTAVYNGLGIKENSPIDKVYGYGITYFFLDLGSLAFNRVKVGDKWEKRFGLEFYIKNIASTRLGINEGNLCAGFGFKVKKFGADFGFTHKESENLFKGSISYFFGEENL